MELPTIEIFNDVILHARVIEGLSKGNEWFGELWGQVDEEEIIITDLLLQKQIVSKVDVNQSLSKRRRSQFRHESIYFHLKKGRLAGKKLLGWIHSHNTMSAFLSLTDRTQVRNYLKEIEFVISIVINSEDDYIPSLRFKIWIDGYHNYTNYRYQILKKQSITIINNLNYENIYTCDLKEEDFEELEDEFNQLVKIEKEKINKKYFAYKELTIDSFFSENNQLY